MTRVGYLLLSKKLNTVYCVPKYAAATVFIITGGYNIAHAQAGKIAGYDYAILHRQASVLTCSGL